jgi:hypothetical protein
MVSRLNCSNLTLDFLDHLPQLTGRLRLCRRRGATRPPGFAVEDRRRG